MSDQGLKDRINAAVKTALRAGEKEQLGTLRMILAEIKQREVDERIKLDDKQILAVLDRMTKARKEAIDQFRAAERQDLVDKESREIVVIRGFLPQQLSDAEIERLVADAITATGATAMKDMAGVMTQLRPHVQGRADMGAVSAKVKSRLS